MAMYDMQTTACEMDMIEKSIKSQKPFFCLTVDEDPYHTPYLIAMTYDELMVESRYIHETYQGVEAFVTKERIIFMDMEDERVIAKITPFSGFPQE